METWSQLTSFADTSTPKKLLAETRRIFCFSYPAKRFRCVDDAFDLIQNLFEGRYRGYRACSTDYHDLDHTLDAMLAAARLLDGYNLTVKVMPEETAVNLMRAALFHDTGYIQETGDTEGTGAKYTVNHVDRSVDFAARNAPEFGLSARDLDEIVKLVRCTETTLKLEDLSFDSDEQHTAGAMLGTADLLGQMSDRTYLEKLIFLYREFREAGIMGFNTEYDIIRKTTDFYDITRRRLDSGFMSVYRYAQAHFLERGGIDRNLYLEEIEKHMAYLQTIIEDSSTNFRHKLRRATKVAR